MAHTFRLIALVLCLLSASFCLSCGERPRAGSPTTSDEPRLVRMEGVGMYALPGLFPVGGKEAEPPLWARLRDRDTLLLWCGAKDEARDEEGFCFEYRQTDGSSLLFTTRPSRVLLADKTVALRLTKDSGWDWLKQATREDLAHLRSIRFVDGPESESLPLLKKAAESAPGAWIEFPESGAGPLGPKVVELFQPRGLNTGGSLFADPALDLSALSKVEFLSIFCAEKQGLAFLASMPRLRELWLQEARNPEDSPLPQGLVAIEKLFIEHAEDKDMPTLARFVTLKELSLGSGKPISIGPLAALPSLRTLLLADCSEVRDLAELKSFGQLTGLAIPEEAGQEGFAAALAARPGLELVAILNSDKLEDLTPLLTLSSLKELYVLGREEVPPAQLEVLGKLQALQVLVLPGKMIERSPDAVAALQKQIPNCKIIAGACLGSGWILLLVPAALVAWVVRGHVLAGRRRCRG